jgi:hypothetical protein
VTDFSNANLRARRLSPERLHEHRLYAERDLDALEARPT